MQPPPTLSAEDAVALIEAPDLHIVPGLDLLDSSDAWIADISGDLIDGKVERDNYRKIHGTCALTISRELVWGAQRVRPRMTLSSAVLGLEERFNAGVYLLTTPERQADTLLYTVEGYDKLLILDTPYGDSYAATGGDSALDLVEALFAAVGQTKVIVDRSASATVLPSSRVWPADDNNTWLRIINDLLASINYRAVWVDWNGYYRVEPYVPLDARAPEWPYSTEPESTIVAPERTRTADIFDVPNEWVFIQNDPSQPFPTGSDGTNGRYVVSNTDDGPTASSVLGYVRRRTVHLDAADSTSLIAQGDRIVSNDKSVAASRTFLGGPNPMHWHWDVFEMVDPDLGATVRMLSEAWTLPLRGGEMSHKAKEIA